MVEHTEPTEGWEDVERPGYFGRSRDMKIATYATLYGSKGWRLVWRMNNPYAITPSPTQFEFAESCRYFYEESYYKWLVAHPVELDSICSFAEVYDNDVSNVNSKLDYNHQESYSTHIQDIAIRNVLARLSREFNPTAKMMLQVRGKESDGERFNPGNIPFAWPDQIQQPSLRPSWAQAGSVEDFWQSNKFLQRRVTP